MAELLDLQILTDEVAVDVEVIHTDGSGVSYNC